MKTQVKHTMGPWYLDFDTVSTEPRRKGYVLAQVSFGSIDPDEVKANAHLIAAAPELLEACKLVAATFKRSNDSGNFLGDDEHEAWNKVDKAIAKAEGVPCHE